jgi:hypothetical protein
MQATAYPEINELLDDLQWAGLIASALLWRAAWRDDTVDHAATFPETLRFVQFMTARIAAT